MPITVFSDPHLGRSMQAHTTAASRERMTKSVYLTVLEMLEANAGRSVLCLGDLFDKFQNPEGVIQQGLEVMKWCSVIMAGNHDITADRHKVGSLDLLFDVGVDLGNDCEVVLTPFGEPECRLRQIMDGFWFVFVPHHTTDELFHQSLEDARDWAREGQPGKKYLCLHCNYDSGFAKDETALSLTRKEAKDLLDSGFDHILIGHDHHPREDWDGRVIIMGNTHPTGFGDITPKRILQIEDDGSHRFKTIWSPEGRFVQVTATALLDGSCQIPESVQFIEIIGKVAPGDVMELSKAVRNLWITFNPMAVRNKVEIAALDGEGSVSHDFASIEKTIAEGLEGQPDLLELFNQYWAGTAPVVELEEV